MRCDELLGESRRLVDLFRSTGDRRDIDQAVEHARAAIDCLPAEARPSAYFQLGVATGTRQMVGNDPADADAAVRAFDAAVSILPAGAPELPSYLFQLAIALMSRFETTNRPADRTASIEMYREGIRLGAGHPRVNEYRSQLAGVLLDAYNDTAEPAALRECAEVMWDAAQSMRHTADAVPYLERALKVAWMRFQLDQTSIDSMIDVLRPVAHDDGCSSLEQQWLARLPALLHMRYEQRRSAADADEGVTLYQKVLARNIPGQFTRVQISDNLLTLALRSFVDVELPAGRTERAENTLQLIRQTPRESGKALLFAELGSALLRTFNNSGDLALAPLAVAALQDGAALLAATDGNFQKVLAQLALAYFRRYDLIGSAEDLDRALDVVHAALVPGADTSPLERIQAMVLDRRFDHFGDPADLEQAAAAARRAFTAAADERDRQEALVCQGTIAERAYRAWGRDHDAVEAVRLYRHALGLAATAVDRANALGYLGCMLVACADGRPAMLHEGVQHLTESAARTPAGDEEHAARVRQLGLALYRRFEAEGDHAILAEAIRLLRTTVVDDPRGRLGHADSRNDLALALKARYQSTGRRDDLDESIALLRNSAELARNYRAAAATPLSNLALVLHLRYGRDADRDALREEIDVLEHVLALLPPLDSRRPLAQSQLGLALRWRAQHEDSEADRQRSLALQREAAANASADSSARAVCLTNLSLRLLSADDALDEAVAAAREALSIARMSDAERTSAFGALGMSLERRYRRLGDQHDLVAAFAAYRDSTCRAGVNGAGQLHVLRLAGDLAARVGNFADAVTAYTAAVDLLPTLSWHGLARHEREAQLEAARDLPGEATAAAIEAGDQRRALELFERARSVLWSERFRSPGPIATLRAGQPEVADRLERLRVALALADAGIEVLSTDEHDRLAREWDGTLASVRAMPGHESFLRVPTVDELLAGTGSTPLIVLNVSALRCDALVVRDGAVSVCPLSGLDAGEATVRMRTYQLALLGHVEHRDSATAGREATVRDLSAGTGRPTDVITSTISWVWDAIAEPILSHLGLSGPPQAGAAWPRLVWCVGGIATQLPVHAAGRPEAGSGHSVLDRVISSYVPTVSAAARRMATSGEPGDDRMLIVDVAGDDQPLKWVEDEVAHVIRCVGPERSVRLSAPTRQDVMTALGGHLRLHFAGHGTQDLLAPADGGLELTDGRLRMADLIGRIDRPGGFAFLNACKTATVGLELPDEAIGLAQALSWLGFDHVIATQWAVPDEACLLLAKLFYQNACDRGRFHPDRCAEALHHAVRSLRATYPDNPAQWAFFVHMGV
ncbi:CHAT domain-containing protein [Dactylosporangium sp. NPDC051541]|uniref:CHAT domain-containing protein n=1 Tax=Dactylosporangium sp. NPDC051541 TaxID=3363977 RepID=UPI0037A0F804